MSDDPTIPAEPLPTAPPEKIAAWLCALWRRQIAIDRLERDPELRRDLAAAVEEARATLADVRRERGQS